MDAGRVVCLAMRKILEKLKNVVSVSRLHVVSWEGAVETTSSTWDQGRALSTEDEAGALGTFDDTWQDGSEDAAPFWHDEGRRGQECNTERASRYVHLEQDRREV